MQGVHDFPVAHDRRVILHAGYGEFFDGWLSRGIAAAEEAEASVRQPQPARDQVEPQHLEFPALWFFRMLALLLLVAGEGSQQAAARRLFGEHDLPPADVQGELGPFR
jgi:hypothetical protein